MRQTLVTVVVLGLVGTLGLFAVQGVPAQEATPAAEVAPLTLESLGSAPSPDAPGTSSRETSHRAGDGSPGESDLRLQTHLARPWDADRP